MLTTMEVRWFCRGKPPADVENWFNADYLGEPLAAPEQREDVYLHTTPTCDYLNLKLRQGRLEVKWRQAEFGFKELGHHWEGKVEKWGKWVCQDSTDESFAPETVRGKPLWVEVQKVRSQRFYQVTNNHVIPIAVNELSDQGCSVELTQLTIRGNIWWSLALEVSGEDTDLINHLELVASWMSMTYPGSTLLSQDSYAYPRWLAIAWEES